MHKRLLMILLVFNVSCACKPTGHLDLDKEMYKEITELFVGINCKTLR